MTLDLYAHLENFRVENRVIRELPGLARSLPPLRRKAWEVRPEIRRLDPREQVMEGLIQRWLGYEIKGKPDDPTHGVIERFTETFRESLCEAPSPETSFQLAVDLTEAVSHLPKKYRGVIPVLHHGWINEENLFFRPDFNADSVSPLETPRGENGETGESGGPVSPDRDIQVRYVENDLQKGKEGLLTGRFDVTRTILDYLNLRRPVDSEPDDEEPEKTLEEWDRVSLVRSQGGARSSFRFKLKAYFDKTVKAVREENPLSDLILYDEWDFHLGGYRKNWCRLVEEKVREGPMEEVNAVLDKYRREVGRLRRQLGSLAVETVPLKRREQGEEIDLDSVVDGFVDRWVQSPSHEKFYVERVRRRRDVAVGFLIDLSASTETTVGGQRIIDIEKEAMLLMLEVLSDLDDRNGVFGFSGTGRGHCEFFVIKSFEEPYGAQVKKRMMGIQPHQYTRMGAPIRHLNRIMEKVDAKSKFLILLSDGKPNDVDVYEGVYGIQDTRKAIKETERRGIRPFCLTIDERARDYLPQIFGPRNFRILTHAGKLPQVIPQIYTHLIH
jgi:nitric oxide reductase NorD protein